MGVARLRTRVVMAEYSLCDIEQSDFNLTLEDNCRVSFLVRGLTKSSGPVVEGFFHVKDIEKKFERGTYIY